MVAKTVPLGVLSLPAAVAGLGLAPAVIILLSLGVVASYTGYVIGQFKWRYPHISSVADAGEVLMGRFGREVLFGGQMLYLIFLMASHLLTFTVALDIISSHATCSIVFGVIGLVFSMLLSLPRTLKNFSWLSMACEGFLFGARGRVKCNELAVATSIRQHFDCCPCCYDRYSNSKSRPCCQGNCHDGFGYWLHIRVEHRLVVWSVKLHDP